MWLRLSIPLQLFHITFGQTGCGMRVVTSKPNSIKCEIPFNQKLDVPHPTSRKPEAGSRKLCGPHPFPDPDPGA